MKKLYSKQAAACWRKKAALWFLILCAVILGMLAVNIVLCCRVNTQNAERSLFTAILLSTLSLWIALFLFVYAYRPSRARAEHMQGILQGEADVFSGVLQRTGERFSIPKSVTVVKFTLTEGEVIHLLHADSALARQLPPDGTRVQVETVRKFITGYEVIS